MATPIFDAEIMKLRRRLGDIYHTDGTEITTSNVGTASIGTVYKRDELVDIYNDAVRLFIDYVVRNIPKIEWNNYIHGYIFLKESVAVSSGVLTAPTDPPLYTVMDMMLHASPNTLFIEVKPDQWLAFKSGFVKTRKYGYVVMSSGSTWAGQSRNIYTTATGAVDLVYITNHTNVTHAGSVDLIGLSNTALQRILVMAEIAARRYRSIDESDEPMGQLQMQTQLDNQPKKD